ncbi:hypothetical protein [Streptomyces rubiginosohelvolus]|uniref:hypothetical protein n=1 Tax=Streptomyces rubiginosohelvolus TaxID=67362 RepID=UPI00380445FE
MNHLLCGLAANDNLPSSLLDRLIAVADAEVADPLADRADLSRAQAVALAARVAESGVPLAYRGRLTAADVDPVARPDVALALLDTGAAPAAWARLLAADPVVEHREKLAACPGLPPDVVETLAADPEIRVVAEAALWAPAQVAARLAAHPHAEVRRMVGANEATPPSVLEALVTGDGLPAARHCLVCDRRTSPFAHDPHGPRPDRDLPPWASCDGAHASTTHDLLYAALRNPTTPAGALVGFVDHPSHLLRRALAARRDLPPSVYELLASDPDPGVRAGLAENPAIGDAPIRALADDDCHNVRRGPAHHPGVPLDVLIAGHHNATAPALLACLDDEARPVAAGHPALPQSVVTDLVAGADLRSAEAPAANPSLPHTVMTELLPPPPVRAGSPGGDAEPAAPGPRRGRDRRTR